ncbi:MULTISPECIES: DNA recombination protein RmuC [unclassified Stenotrophomonas]|uniref:DNA recombination protein RmuC n=1 Tax=unclassified Stenotrophomonas TaxID=196198 RepID=UPI000D178B8D|nr:MULTISPECIES: DNA recombination protein RmuC [unclassified Stenotrophomonas]PTA71850.1 DNA recombination protein RmuC [Stenotrophomonas sp. Nf1]PTA76891.1 DNA recombination protein RmuC [Stenotrophomonas sp. Nf4]
MQTESLLIGGLLLAVLILQLVALLRRPPHDRLEQAVREEARAGRSELREQLDTFARALTDLSTRTDQRLDLLREALGEDARKARAESAESQQRGAALMGQRLQELRGQLDTFGQQQEARIHAFGQQLQELTTRTDSQLGTLRQTQVDDARKGREEGAQSQQRLTENLGQRLQELTQRNEQRIAEMRTTLEEQLRALQSDNAQKLEQMRVTVDEKLQSTLETRLGQSFKLVSERLEQVQRGLGEMQQLATGVGDLKRVLTNVKTRGSWGEVQLENILEQTLIQEQYARAVKVRPDSGEMVDIAVRLPGRSSDDTPVWLPIDSKFPREDYERLLDAQEQGDAELVRVQGAQLERAVKVQAKSICEKYIVPPHTTDFAVMFLPTEGLYAEVIRRPGLVDLLQRDHRVVVAGPTTITALLNSLQMGFRTLAIEKRSSEVWSLLGAVKTEFGKFGDVLDNVKAKLDQASKQIDQTGVRTRAIARKLRDVESLPVEQSRQLLPDALPADDSGDGEEA